jgi:hypothetical protein
MQLTRLTSGLWIQVMKTSKHRPEQWYAKVSFYTAVMSVKDTDEANAKVSDLISRLAKISTKLGWDDVDWELERVVQENE